MDFKFPLFFNKLETKPIRGTDDFYRLIDEEVYKLENGIVIDGVQISGWLYWHINHWYIRIDKKEDNGNVTRITSLPHLRDNEWIRAEALEECRKQQKGYMEIGLRQGGKELADYEPLITENGYSPIGDAKIGDKIFSKDGKLCNITGVYPQGLKPIYRMYLSDGRFIDSGENHLWEVFDSSNRKMIKSTKDLLNTKISFSHKRSGTTYKYSIENCSEIEFSKKELPIPPYVLGALLGDGSTTKGTNVINCLDKQIVDEMKTLLPDYDINCQSFKNLDGTLNICQHTIVYKGEKKLLYNENPLNKSLKELNLKCKAPYKFIPTIYKMSSVEDRYEILRGIFDTDGYISENGSIELKLSSKELIEDVAWILRSLGISCSIGILDKRGIEQKLPDNRSIFTKHIYYRLYVKTDKPIFKLKRKLNRLKKRTRKNRVSINRIEFLCNHTATCITVDNPEHLFLTKDFIVTHNSELEASFLAYNATLFRNTQNVIVGGNSDDLILLKDKVDFGLKNLWEGIAIPRLDKTWKTSSVRLGYKLASGEDDIWSTIIIRNAADGNNTETAAGTTAKSYIMDEALKYNSLLYKEDSEITIEECVIGDKIYDDKGELTTILDKIDVGKKQLYEITLADNRTIESCEDHLWEVFDNVTNKIRVLSTKELIKTYRRVQIDKRYNKTVSKFRYFIINNNPINYPEKKYLLDPYYLGLWLGDGSSNSAAICNVDYEVNNFLNEYAQKLNLIYNYNAKNYLNTLISKNKKNYIIDSLKWYNVYKNKHIPDIYLKGSVKQRLALLQGLMDTDGSCSKKGVFEFSSSIPKLADDFEKLCRSLGISIKRKEKKTTKKISYRFHLYTELPIFRVKRKLNNYNLSLSKKKRSYLNRCAIQSIVATSINQAYCIKVDNESKLFLTNNYTVTHNCGKYKFSKVFEAAKPALNSEFGWRAIPLLVGTGGAFEKGEDAERFFYHPDANNFLGFVDPESGKKTCLFMSGLYRQDAKVESTLGQFLKDQGREIPDDSYLVSIVMKVKDDAKALEIITKAREAKKQDPDQQEYLKVIMYHPLTPEECFLSVSNNIFNRNLAKSQQRFLYDNNITGSYVSLEHDGESIKHTFVNKKPVSNFPHKHSDDTDAPVQIWEMPIANAPYGLYTAGVDSYRQANSADSASLGAVYIFKRVHNIHDEKYQNMFVAAYVARPEDKNKWNETARNLIKFYNARTLVENDEASFIDYMISKGDEHYLEPEPQYLKGLVANSRVVGRRYGIHRSAAVIMNHLHTTFKTYMEEVIATQRDKETGAIVKEVLGCSQILDPMLLEEVIKFNPDINVDRIVAAELALSLGLYLNRSIGTLSSTNEDARMQSYINHKKTKSVFSNTSTIFTKRKSLF